MLLKPSRYEELNREALDLLETYGVTNFPLDVFQLAKKMGICLKPYSSIPLAEFSALEEISEDAFTVSPGEYEIGSTFVCFNQNANKGRLRQDIAHEIAHIWLEHATSEEPFETEAEYFAAYLLAPIPLIIKYRLKTIREVRGYFEISHEAARIALERASNRCACRKPGYDYEYRIIEICQTKGGGYLELA